MNIIGTVPATLGLTYHGDELIKEVHIYNTDSNKIREVMEVTLYDTRGRAYNYIVADKLLDELV